MNLRNKRVLVVGLARTGIAVVHFLTERGGRVRVSEAKPAAELAPVREALKDLGVEWETGGHTASFFADADLIIVSPGVPMEMVPLSQARARGIPVISEVELAYRYLRPPLIALTGTNGKTTTTTLIGKMLQAGGRSVFVGGNIGNPLIHFAATSQPEEWVVAEISSFQLEGIHEFRPFISLLLNITEDHLDRYRTFEDYIGAKAKIFQNQTEEDYAILNADDPLAFQFAAQIKPKVFFFSAGGPVSPGCYLSDRDMIFQASEGGRERFDLRRLKIKGAHNLENLMAAALASKISGCPHQAIQQVINSFTGLEHRLEWVREVNGVGFFNDSKGTNVGSVVKSLMSFRQPVLLIAGGKDKGGDYGPLKGLVAERVKGIALIGEARDRIFQALGGLTETAKLETLEAAVHWAVAKASPGDVILLSPACSSFDMFANYQERGRMFKEIVRAL